MDYDITRTFDYFLVKTRLNLAFPNGLAYSCTATGIESIPSWEPFRDPASILSNISRYVPCTKAHTNNPPNCFGNRALEKEMIY